MSFDLEYARSLCAVGGLSLRYAEETGSTNADLLAGEAAPDGAVLIAGRQSAGLAGGRALYERFVPCSQP